MNTLCPLYFKSCTKLCDLYSLLSCVCVFFGNILSIHVFAESNTDCMTIQVIYLYMYKTYTIWCTQLVSQEPSPASL